MLLRIGLGIDSNRKAVGAGLANAETTTWVNAVVGDGGSVSAGRQTLVDTLISSLKSGGIWTKKDRLWLFAAEDSQSALRDVKAASAATANGGPTFATDRGYTGTNTSATVYIDSNFNPSTAGGNYTQNSGHISVWVNSDVAATSTGGIAIGLLTAAGSQSNIFPEYSDGKSYYRVNDPQGSPSAGIVDATSVGHRLANRSGSSAQQGYKDAVDQGVVAGASAALSNGNFAILGSLTTAATHNFGCGNQISAVSIGGSLTSGEVTSFYNALRIYMTAVGVS